MKPNLSFDEACRYVSALEGRGWRLGLDRMRELVRRAGLLGSIGDGPAPQYIHVAGTNGKGSTTAYIQSILQAGGIRSGGYFSPFVYSVRERICIGGSPVSETDFSTAVAELAPIAESFEGDDLGLVTEFEFKTAMGIWLWQHRQCECVALETGMGGRLDATNIVESACSVITSIGLDHTAYLGETHAAIAEEKAGILKPGKPAVLGPMPPSAREAVVAIVSRLGCPLIEVHSVKIEADRVHAETSDGSHWLPLPGIPGPNQAVCASLAAAAVRAAGLQISAEALADGVRSAWLPGRFERRSVGGIRIVLDGAHNAESAEALSHWLRTSEPSQRWILVANMLHGHDPDPFFRSFQGVAESLHVPPIDFHRARAPQDTAEVVGKYFSRVQSHEAMGPALRSAMAEAESSDAAILITGSFYLVGEAGNLLDAWSS